MMETLGTMTSEQLDSDVTVYDENMDEFFPVHSVGIAEDNGVLDPNHPFLRFSP
jgi:hypothetical protein